MIHLELSESECTVILSFVPVVYQELRNKVIWAVQEQEQEQEQEVENDS